MAKPKYKKQYVEDLLTYFFKFIEMRDDPDEGDKAERQGFLLMEPGVDGVYTRIPPKPSSGYPTLTKFAIKKGISPRTLTNWRKKYSDFDEACEFAEAMFKDILEERALTSKWDSKTAMKILELRAAAKREADEALGNHIQITFKNLTKPTLELKEQEGITSEDTGYIDER
jgi:hypothetical protein